MMSNRKPKYLIALVFTAFAILPGSAFAEGSSGGMDMGVYTTWVYIAFAVILGILLLITMVESGKEYTAAEIAAAPVKESSFKKFMNRWVQEEAPADESSIMMEDEYDGIQELNNKIPPWFNYLFYGSMVFAVVYMLNYHVFGSGKSMFDEYGEEVVTAEAHKQELIRTGAFINEETVKKLADGEVIAEGRNIYMTNCSPCHGTKGEGTVGPNLTDDNWIHGGGIKNVFKTVKYGVPSKGMLSWQQQMNPKQMQAVANYILTLKGTNPPNGKAPEGEKYTEEQ
jgi:cytochrome c oxidase cbb3-type subunit 3